MNLKLIKKLRMYRGYFYMATPYSKFPGGKDAAYEEARSYMHQFLINRIFVYSPIVHCHDLAKNHSLPTDHLFWEEFNIRMMLASCGGIFIRMNGFDESEGCQMERAFFVEHYMPSFEFDAWL